MKYVSIAEFSTNLVKFLKLTQEGENFIVTSKGKPVATVGPPADLYDDAKERLQSLAQSAIIHDVISPIGESWGTGEIRKYRGKLKWDGDLDEMRRD